MAGPDSEYYRIDKNAGLSERFHGWEPWPQRNETTTSMAADTLFAARMVLPAGGIIKKIGWGTVVAANRRMGVFANSLTLGVAQPGALIADLGIISSGSNFATSLALEPGLYWVGSLFAVAYTVRSHSGAVGGGYAMLGYSLTTGVGYAGWSVARLYSAGMPTTWPVGSVRVSEVPGPFFVLGA